MSPRATLALLAVVIALFVTALAVGLRRDAGAPLTLPGWSEALGDWLAGEQELPLGDLRPASSVKPADVDCHADLTQHRTLTLLPNGACGLFVGASSRSVRTLALRLEAGARADVWVDWVDRDDRLTEEKTRPLVGNRTIRLQFYEEGGGIGVACPTGCTLAVATPGRD